MSCPTHPQWVKDPEDCPFCIEATMRELLADHPEAFGQNPIPDIVPGQFYDRSPNGKMTPATPDTRFADVWVCRRLRDYAPSPVPLDSGIASCRNCGCAIVFNPKRLVSVPPDTPMICMQCAHIQPLPIES